MILASFRREFDAARDPQAARSALQITGANNTWTPTLTFATPGDLSVTYSTRLGRYMIIGPLYHLWWQIVTSAFTHTTAVGAFQISGLPITKQNSALNASGTVQWSGITKATYTQVVPQIGSGASVIGFFASGSGVARSSVVVADVPTGGSIILIGHLSCFM